MRWSIVLGALSVVFALYACADVRIDLGDDGPADARADETLSDVRIDADAGSADAPSFCAHGDPFSASRLVAGFETSDVWSARLSPDELTVYLAFPSTAGGTGGFDLYSAGRFTAASAFGARTKLSISTLGDDYWPTTSEDQKIMFFESPQNPDGGAPLGSRVWFASRDTVPGNFRSALWDYFASIPDTATEGSPYLSPSGRTLYWSSIGRGPHASIDLWAADVTAAGTVVSDYRLAGTINTDTDTETFPVITSDDRELFFARVVGSEPGDMYVSQRSSPADGFSRVEKVGGGGLNTAEAGEWPSWVSPDHCRLYFIRTRTVDGGIEARLWFAERAPNR